MSKKAIHSDQAGIVSFIVVIVIMFMLSLIVLSFARLARREQVQTLDRQLNTQALYAAESGVNDAVNALNSGTVPPYNDNCEGAGSFMINAGLNNDLGNEVSYSCLIVDDSPPFLEYLPVSTELSTVVPLSPPSPGGNINTLEISFDDPGGLTTISGCPNVGQLPTQWNVGNTCQIGMLRIELVQFNGAATRANLISNRGIAFLQPSRTGGPLARGFTSIDGDDQGTPMPITCTGATGPRRCYIEITGLNMAQGYLRMQSIYRPVNVTIDAETAAGGDLDLVGAQAELDVTGRANGVLKRIKVNASIPTNDGIPLPSFALQSTKTQCKRFTSRPGVIAVDSIAVSLLTADGLDPNIYCHPTT